MTTTLGHMWTACSCNCNHCFAGHTIQYVVDYLRERVAAAGFSTDQAVPDFTAKLKTSLGKLAFWQKATRRDVSVRLHIAGGQTARLATPVSSPTSQQFKLVAQAIYETVQPPQVRSSRT